MPRKKGSLERVGAIASCSAPSSVRLVSDDTGRTGLDGISHSSGIFAKPLLRPCGRSTACIFRSAASPVTGSRNSLARRMGIWIPDRTHSFLAFGPNLRVSVSASTTTSRSRRRFGLSLIGLNRTACILVSRNRHSSLTSACSTRSRNKTAPAHSNTIAIRVLSGDVMCKGE